MKTNQSMTRRGVLCGGAAAAAGALTGVTATADEKKLPTNGKINHSLVRWCYSKYWKDEELAKVAKGIGCASLELIDPKQWDMLKSLGLKCAIASSHGFVQGMNNPKYWERTHKILTERIEQSAAAGVPSVITFTGMREDIPDDVGMENCVKGFKQIIGLAEKKGVNLCLEMLNSRHGNGFMQGHPGYQGDHTDYCIEICKRVGSERMKLLFDIYHVSIMDGDIITRIHQHKDYIGHVHTAGNPGRGELDDKQEINYRPIMQALVDIGYKGYVGHEFIPTREPLAGLKEAIAACEVA